MATSEEEGFQASLPCKVTRCLVGLFFSPWGWRGTGKKHENVPAAGLELNERWTV